METVNELYLLIKYLFLGFLQGFTEPIPISSSGHLVLVRELMNIEIEGLSFEILVNFASLIAVLVIYRNDIIRLAQNFFRYLSKKDPGARGDYQFIWYLVVATIPAGVIGVLFEEFIESKLSKVSVIGYTLLITGLALWIIRNLRGRKNDGDLTLKDALIVGFAQAVALIPGISRSGATIVAAMLVGMKSETALRFSFLLYIPVSLGVTILSVGEILGDPNISALAIPYVMAFAAALIASYYSLRWFMGIMARGNLKYFAFYCFIVGILVILFI
ncbi:undecaprenyl-diphosphate phosphatase [Virgibacillus kekensis]|uniref:Undecaprenyl-diphosphatase n=1 Tax=Virgibacillus kekensis TaxID=202261 RepID=A0ABV9DKP3_9BACI